MSEPLTPAPATSKDEPSHLQTRLPDLTDVTIFELRNMKGLEDQIEQLIQQVARPRFNLGGAGPPGRSD